jgi:flagellar biosynthesis GTPase FlhF
MHIRVVSVQKLKILETKMKEGDWIINYHADYCGHCQSMKPEWEKFISKMKNNNNINIADIESKMIPQMKEQPSIAGYPTVKYYHNNKDVADHNGERTCQGFEQFTNEISNNKVNKPTPIKPVKQYPTLGNTLGDVDSSSKPMDDILKLFSDKLNGSMPIKAVNKAPIKSKKTKKSTTIKTKKTKKSTPTKSKKTKKTKKSTPTKSKKTKKTKKSTPTKSKKTKKEIIIKTKVNTHIVKTPQQKKAEKRKEKRKQQQELARKQRQEQGKGRNKDNRQHKIIKNLRESIANIKDQATKDKKLLNELSK